MSSNESMEMYLETVYILEKNHGHAHVVDIANELGVSKPSVTKAMKLLKSEGLIQKEAYGSITLTKQGLNQSKAIYNKHRSISMFLEHSLGLSMDEASSNACKMEHILSSEMLDAIQMYLKQHRIYTDL